MVGSSYTISFVLLAFFALGNVLALSARDDALPDALLYESNQSQDSDLGSMPLDGRSLLNSWLGKRGTCLAAGDSPCPSMSSFT